MPLPSRNISAGRPVVPGTELLPYGEKTRPGQCPEQQLIARHPSMINEAREVLCQVRFPAWTLSDHIDRIVEGGL